MRITGKIVDDVQELKNIDTKKVKQILMEMGNGIKLQRPRFFKRILSTGKPVGVARSFAKAYIRAKGNLPQVLKARYPNWSHEKVDGFCSQYPNVYDLTCYIISRECNLKISGIDNTHPEVVSSVLVGFSEIGLFNYLELNGKLENLIVRSHLGKDIVEQYEPLEETDSKTKKSNQLEQIPKGEYVHEIGRELRRAYDKLCNEAFESFKELHEDIEVPQNLEFEIASLLYFAFDIGMASGTETEIRNKIRDAFLEAKPIDEVEAERTSSRVEEYLNELRTEHDREKQMLLLGNVFAKHTGNEDDISVVTWAFIQYGTSFRFVTDLMKEIDSKPQRLRRKLKYTLRFTR